MPVKSLLSPSLEIAPKPPAEQESQSSHRHIENANRINSLGGDEVIPGEYQEDLRKILDGVTKGRLGAKRIG